MSDTLEAPAVPVSAETIATAPANTSARVSITAAALERCLQAYQRKYRAAAGNGPGDIFTHRAASEAYRLAMPSTETLADIQALIACVTQGINLQVYEGRESTQLLYAAQVALAAQKPPKAEKAKREEPKPEKK
jgi:hypothetical protein